MSAVAIDDPLSKACRHDNLAVQAAIEPGADITRLTAILRFHCARCGRTWEIVRSCVTPTPQP